MLFLRSVPLALDTTLVPMLGVGKNLAAKRHHDWLYHKEAIIKENTVHAGLGHGIVDFARYDQTFPHYIYTADQYPDDVITPCFYTGSYLHKGVYGLSYAACAYNKGKGKIVLNAFGIEENIGHPAADRLLLNYIDYLT